MSTARRTKAEARPFLAFTRADMELANDTWGANCGPASLAAALEITLDDVRPRLDGFEHRRHMNVPQMKVAAGAFGVRMHQAYWRGAKPAGEYDPVNAYWPTHGLVLVQWTGSWCKPGVPAGAAAARRHWMASRIVAGTAWIYDGNGSDWMTLDRWVAEICPLLIECVKGCDGWYVSYAWELILPSPLPRRKD